MKKITLEVSVLAPDTYNPKNADDVLYDLDDRHSEVSYVPEESRILEVCEHNKSITVEEFLKQVDGARGLLGDIMNHEVEVQIHGDSMPGYEFIVERVGYKFNPVLVWSDGTQGSLIIDLKRK